MHPAVKQIFDVCFAVNDEKVLIITDNASHDVAKELTTYPANISALNLDQLQRPVRFTDIKNLIDASDIVLFVASKVKGEVQLRSQIREYVPTVKKRFANMPGITYKALDVVALDQKKLWDINKKVYDVVKDAKELTITTPKGTNLAITLGNTWVASDSNMQSIPQGGFNIPSGECFTCPVDVNGTAVIDGVLGDYFVKYGPLEKTPLTLLIENGRVVKADCDNKELLNEFLQYIKTDENANRIGEIGIGTAIGMTQFYGIMLVDEKFPGAHIAVGNTYKSRTGASWESTLHCDGILKNPTILVDKKLLFDGEQFNY